MGKPKRQESQRQDLPFDGGRPEPALFVAATPIGNLGDASARLRQVLGGGRTILAEDTRRTLDLCRGLDLTTGKIERCDAHTRSAQWDRWVERAQAGERFVLVSDAGTPGISDPGAEVVQAFAQAGLGVEAVPGPSAVATALSLCGFSETAYVFWGFFPRSAKERAAALAQAATSAVRVHAWFESPERITEAFAAVTQATEGLAVQAAAFRELTKRFETSYRGTVEEVARQIQTAEAKSEARGEWIFVLQWPVAQTVAEPTTQALDWSKTLEMMMKAGASTAGAAREVAAAFGVSRDEVYARAVQLKKFS